MAQVEEQIIAEGVELIWLLEEDSAFRAGTAQSCRTFMNQRGSNNGWCVGDGETMPTAGVFDNSSFSIARGFDMVVRRSDMRILWTSSHGTPAGNENLTGQEVLDQIRTLLGR